jgi:hypothetical protein
MNQTELIDIKGPVLYKDAINYIHNQLHSIDFDKKYLTETHN